jgi:hypothetical protein
MMPKTEQETGFIKMVANRLAEKFLEPLLLLSKVKNYSTHIGGLAEMLDWSWEFYDQYYDKIINWERFRWSGDNIYNVVTLDGLIVAFGRHRIKKFYAQNANHSTYFLEKYSVIEYETHLQF